jgi:small-conductance mechanosensitive channel
LIERPLRIFGLIAVLALAPGSISAAGGAQETAAPQEGEVAAPTAPVDADLLPVAEGEIPGRANRVAADLRRIESFITPLDEIERIRADVGSREDQIVTLLQRLDEISVDTVSARRLADARVPWATLGDELLRWNQRVAARYGDLQSERERLRTTRELWESTQQQAAADTLAPELRRRISDLLVRIRDVESRVRSRRNEVGALTDRIAGNIEVAADALDRLDELAARVRGNLLRPDSPPLWRVPGAETFSLDWSALTAATREWAESLVEFVRVRTPAMSAVLLAWLAFVWGLGRLRPPKGGGDEGSAEGTLIGLLAKRRYSLGLAAALLLGTASLRPAGAGADIQYLVAGVAMLRLGRLVLGAPLARAVPWVVLLAVWARLSSILPDGGPGDRLILLLLGLAGAGLALLWRARTRPGPDASGLERAIFGAARPLAVVFSVGFVAAIAGWVELARTLTYGSALTTFGAFALAMVLRVVDLVLPWIIQGGLGDLLPSLRNNLALVTRTISRYLDLGVLIVFALRTLDRFELYDYVSARVVAFVSAAVSFGDVEVSVGGVLLALAILVVARLVERLARFVITEELSPRFDLGIGARESVVTLARYIAYGIAIALAASAIGLSGTQVTVVLGALSVGIGFGLQNIVSNFVSGLILMFEQPVKVGDTVETATRWGRISRIGIRASTIRAFTGAEIIVPNADLISKEVINWTLSDDRRRLEIPFGVAYGTNPEAVLELALRVAAEHPAVLKDPAPDAQMLAFGASSLDFRLRAWATMENAIQVSSDLYVGLTRALGEAGIEIPFPQRDLHVRSIRATLPTTSAAPDDEH